MQNFEEEDFKQKYLKYKTKYLNLKGGIGAVATRMTTGRSSSGSRSDSSYYPTILSGITDKNEALFKVTKDGLNIVNVSKELQNDKDVVLAAVKNYGNALLYASDTLKNDKDVVLAAGMQNSDALRYASNALKNDKDILFEIVKKDYTKFEDLIYSNNSLLDDSKYMIKIMKEIPKLFEICMYEPFSKEFRNDESFKNKLPDQKLVDMKSKYSNEIKTLYNETVNLKCDSLINTTTCRTFTKNIKTIEEKIKELKDKIKDWDKLFLSDKIKRNLQELKNQQSNCGCMTSI